jgi:hypothetical protein
MRYRYLGGALLAAIAALTGPGVAKAQFDPTVGDLPFTDGSGGGFQVPSNANPIIHLPTGQAGQAGFYTAFEYVMLAETRAVGNQVIARRGFIDSAGVITGTPGTIVGSNTVALDTKNFSGAKFAPGYNIELGYRFEDGTRLFWNYENLIKTVYSRGASLVLPGFRSNADLSDTFMYSPVYAFNTYFAGPQSKIAQDATTGGYNAYGIWNGASQNDIKFSQRYSQMETGVRSPLFQSEYSRLYGIAGGQFSWFYERFNWRSVSLDSSGNSTPQDAADYTNTLSQRMYGAMVGLGHELFVANQFSLSLDITGSLLVDIAKERAKYQLGDETVESKWGLDQYRVVPNANLNLNLWWYPIEGVQVRIGYQAMTFYNTLYMKDPVGFNYGDIKPQYDVKYFRLIHGFNVGIGFFF